MEGLAALEDVTMLCVPDLMTTMPGETLDLQMVKAVQRMMIDHCEGMADRVAILDAPPGLKPKEIDTWRMDTTGYDSTYAALYYPWIEIQDPIQDRPLKIPPCGHMAGIWARNDNTRGVHKAPANEVVLGATGLAYNITKGEQDVLNPNGINCIRAFPGRGIRVWGARTLTSDPAWRYINVRRLFNFVEKSIERGTQWVVFEPNDRMLWARVRRDITAFLRVVWSDGALFGNSPSEAFYVKCDDELNPPESRDLGRLIIEIGLCPVKPAEFVIFRISQWAGPNAEN
jgi:phage tail sheath protein FI